MERFDTNNYESISKVEITVNWGIAPTHYGRFFKT